LVHGDSFQHIFPVKIAVNESVGSLKVAIKAEKKPAFDHVPADTLKLFNVSASDVGSADGELLLPMDRLSKVFLGEPKEGCLHIIIKPPIIGKRALGQ
jgi:hypothetical protein